MCVFFFMSIRQKNLNLLTIACRRYGSFSSNCASWWIHFTNKHYNTYSLKSPKWRTTSFTCQHSFPGIFYNSAISIVKTPSLTHCIIHKLYENGHYNKSNKEPSTNYLYPNMCIPLSESYVHVYVADNLNVLVYSTC